MCRGTRRAGDLGPCPAVAQITIVNGMTQPYSTVLDRLREMNASDAEYAFVETLTGHGRDEAWFLERYQQYADQVDDPAIRYLIGLVLDDERRHHRVLAEIIQSAVFGAGAPGALPDRSPGGVLDEDLLALTEQLLAAEHRERKELRELRKRLQPWSHATIWPLLVEMMEHDTAKHEAVLRYIAGHSRH